MDMPPVEAHVPVIWVRSNERMAYICGAEDHVEDICSEEVTAWGIYASLLVTAWC
jgi:hypothetical protein